MLEPIRAKSGGRNWRARRSRKREDNDDSTKTIAPRRTPRRSSQKRPSQPIHDLICLSGGKDFLFSFTADTSGPTLSGRGEVSYHERAKGEHFSRGDSWVRTQPTAGTPWGTIRNEGICRPILSNDSGIRQNVSKRGERCMAGATHQRSSPEATQKRSGR
jgi:hypothetical protein